MEHFWELQTQVPDMSPLEALDIFFLGGGLTLEERFLGTFPLLSQSALKIFEYSHPTTYPQLCDMLTQRFSDKHDWFHKFQQLVALHQGTGGFDEYMEKFWSCRCRFLI